MTTFVHSFSSRQLLCLEKEKFPTVRDVKLHLQDEEGLPADSYFFICNGKIVQDTEPVHQDAVYHTHLRIHGGKGGFGSMLRAIGAQIEKTTNREACRDLSGRRMRDVNNEKDLKDWLGKQAEREREREQRRQERIARRRAMPNHKFEDPLYDQQRSKLAENQEDALLTGLKKAQSRTDGSEQTSSSSKRKTDSAGSSGISKKKKGAEWLGVDIDDLSDMSDLSDEDSGSNSNRQTDKQPAQSSSNDTEDSNSSGPATDVTGQIQTSDNSVPSLSDSVVKQETDTAVLDNSSENSGEATVDGKQKDSDCEQVTEAKPFVLEEVSSVKELCVLGLDGLKSELMSRGLKCGGTLEQRAERLFSVRGLSKDQIDPSLFSKSKDGKNVKGKK